MQGNNCCSRCQPYKWSNDQLRLINKQTTTQKGHKVKLS